MDHSFPRRQIGIIVFVLIVFGIFGRSAYADKSYRITHVVINSQLREDGSMEITESRTFQFSGAFRFSFRTLPTTGSLIFEDFHISENGQFYRSSESEEPGTFRVIRKAGMIEVRWFFSAEDELRTFDFRFKAHRAVKRHEDVAVLYYQFISGDWDHASRNVQVRLMPPVRLLPSQVQEWLHGPLWAESRIESDGSITAWCEHLPEHTFLEIRALYPSDVFLDVPNSEEQVRDLIVAEEARWVEESNRLRELASQKREAREKRQEQGKWITIILAALGLLCAWSFYRRYGSRPASPPAIKFSSEIPERISPALVGYLLANREIYGGAMVATLMDLAKREFIQLRENEVKKHKLFGRTRTEKIYEWVLNREHWQKNSGRLAAFETELIRFIFDDLAEGRDTISIKEITKQRNRFIKFFRVWKKDVKKIGEAKNWFDKKSISGMYYALGLGLAMAVLSGISAFLYGIWAVILGGASACVCVLSLFIPHRIKEGEMYARQWKALKRYLAKYHYRSVDKKSLLSRIDEYLVYGVVLGLSEKVFKELAALIPIEEFQRYVPWYLYQGAGSRGFSPDAFASAFSSMVATTTSAMSTAAGAGGGASAGGGGGAGSGGGGAG